MYYECLHPYYNYFFQAENEFVADSDFEMSDDDIEDINLPEAETSKDSGRKRPRVEIEYEMEGEPKEKERLTL